MYNPLVETVECHLRRLSILLEHSPTAVLDAAALSITKLLQAELTRRLANGPQAWKLAELVQAQLDATINQSNPLPPLPTPPDSYTPLYYHDQIVRQHGRAEYTVRRCCVPVWQQPSQWAMTDAGQALVFHCEYALDKVDSLSPTHFHGRGRDAAYRWLTVLENLPYLYTSTITQPQGVKQHA